MLSHVELQKQIQALPKGDMAARREAARLLKQPSEQDWAAVPPDVLAPLVEVLRQQLLPPRGDGEKFSAPLRRDIVAILGNLGARAAPALPELIGLLDGRVMTGLRDEAILTLGKIGASARAAIEKLLPLLSTTHHLQLITRVTRALVAIGQGDATVQAALTDLWLRPGPCEASRLQAGLALCCLKLEAPGLLTALTRVLVTGPSSHLRRTIPPALAERDPEEAEVVPALAAALHDDDDEVRRLAAAALKRLHVSPAEAIERCARLWQDSLHAEVALRRSGSAAVCPLCEALAAATPAQRERAARILGSLGKDAAAAAPALTQALQDRHQEVRLAAAKALWNITNEAEAVVPVLTGLLTATKGAAPEVGEARRQFLQTVIEALGRIGPAARPAIPALLEKAHDDNRLIRESALRALQAIDAPAANRPTAAARFGY